MITDKTKLKKGMKIYFIHKNKVREAFITRLNQKTVSVINEKEDLRGRLGYGGIYLEKPETTTPKFSCPQLERTNLHTQEELESLMGEIKIKMKHVFDNLFTGHELVDFYNVRIYWGKKITYQNLGKYFYGISQKANSIQISPSLKHAPKHVIGRTIYHELLHIKFHDHSATFKRYEAMYPEIKEANDYENLLMHEIKYYGIERLMKLPIKKEVKKPKIEKKTPSIKNDAESEDEKIVRILKEKGHFPSYLIGKELDEYDIRFLKNKFKSL